MKNLSFILLPVKGPDHPHAGEILPHMEQHPVQLSLHFSVHRNRDAHDPKHHCEQHRNHACEDERRFHIDGKGHDHGSEHDKGRAQEEAQHQVHSRLHLVDIAGDPGDQRRGADCIQLLIGKTVQVGKKRPPHLRTAAHCSLGREILSRNRTDQAGQAKKNQDAAPSQHVGSVAVLDSHVDDIRHHKGDQKLQAGLQKLEQRPQDALLPVIPHKI